ncbi:MAG: sigma-70 family RNA polymerase sigma factor [Peptoniphilaceae bacterium]|nr:sigma-70 family RNA polymerase sigma factor [Peptoniphilaceae bacterium]MDY6085924.1 sigma-70 family RNA polymerase sigma factor [Peptoniphilaceae bacterium]
MRPANDLGVYSQFFALHKNLAYQIAFTYTQDEETAERVVEQAMRQMRLSGFLDSDLSREDKRGLLALITRHRALVAARENHNAAAHREEALPKPTMVGDAEVSIYGELISKIPTRDRIVLIMVAVYGLSDATIARALQLKPAAVTKRRQRSLQFIAEQYDGHKDPESLLEDASFLTALTLWLKGRINSIEAMSNMDPHAFSAETEERIIQAMADPRRERAFRALDNAGNISLFAGILVLVVVLAIVIAQAFKSNDRPNVVALDSSLVFGETQEGLESMATEAPVEKTKRIPLAHVAVVPGAVVFYDADDGRVYRAPAGQEAQEVLDIGETVEQAYGLQHIGEVDGTIYLALIDGRGAHIEGSPAKLVIEPYWQESWFADGKEPDASTRVRRGGVAYTFGAEEETED